MKKLHVLMLVLATLFFGCEKAKIEPESLEGKWELRHILGVQVADSPSDFEKGNGSTIEFSGNEYHITENGTVISKGTYVIVKESAEIDGTEYQNRIVFDNADQKIFIKLSNNKLLICRGSIAADGSTATYEKM
jgi:hypothetical protein